jgi:pyruvate-formate lyase-activating enzyme
MQLIILGIIVLVIWVYIDDKKQKKEIAAWLSQPSKVVTVSEIYRFMLKYLSSKEQNSVETVELVDNNTDFLFTTPHLLAFITF